MTTDPTTSLAPEETRRLIEFARAFKAAARAVVLYPPAHPNIATALGRIVDITSGSNLSASLRIGVLVDNLLLEGLTPGRPDAAIGELALLLHGHLIGELTVHPGGDVEAWRHFLVLVGRTPDDLRNEGGITRVWSRMSGCHVELREIDYAEVLREHDDTGSSSWSDIVANCLSREGPELDEASRRLLLKATGNVERLENLVATLDEAAIADGRDEPGRAATMVRLFDQLATTVAEKSPDQVAPLLDNLAITLSQRSPEIVMAVLSQPADSTETPGLISSVVSHMSDRHTARFIARHVMADETPTERLAQVFETLVSEDRRAGLLALAKAEASPAATDVNDFEERWKNLAQALLTSYSDKPFVSDQYARELSRARETAIDVEQVSDDPPERMSAWLSSVSASELRKLDLALVGDLLRIESDGERWAGLMRPVVTLIDDLMLVGDFEAADGLVGVLVSERLSGTTHRQAASVAIDRLVAGPAIGHLAGHLATAEDAPFECVKGMFLALGESTITPLAEVLIEEGNPRTRERLMAILIAFGASGRREIDRLKSSPNAVARQTAVELVRRFGGSEALSELSSFLNDEEPQVQLEAVRAILSIGTGGAYAVLGRALTEGTPAQRDTITSVVSAARDERCAPLFAYILRHVDHRGPLTELYFRAIKALGSLKDPVGIDPLQEALHRGEWWAPRRTTALREASAAALARIGTPDAVGVLEQAVASGSRGVRAAARAHLTTQASGTR